MFFTTTMFTTYNRKQNPTLMRIICIAKDLTRQLGEFYLILTLVCVLNSIISAK